MILNETRTVADQVKYYSSAALPSYQAGISYRSVDEASEPPSYLTAIVRGAE